MHLLPRVNASAVLVTAALAAAPLPALVPAVRAADPPAVEGSWKWSWTDAEGTEHPRVLKIRKVEGKLAAVIVGDNGEERPVSEVRVEGDTLHVVSKLERDGQEMEIRYEGKVEGDTIRGKVRIGSNEFPWVPLREAAPAPDPRKDEWIPLIKGYSPAESGWKLRREPKDKQQSGWTLKDGVLTNTVPQGGSSIDLVHEKMFKDFELHVEFRVPARSNSGVYLRGCYEIQVDDAHGKEQPTRKMCAAIYDEKEPGLNASLPAGEWQTFDITLQGNKVTVVHNGKKVIDGFQLTRKTGGALEQVDGKDLRHGDPGPIMLQGDHGNVEYRNMKVRPLATRL
jgi:hypothetical protein